MIQVLRQRNFLLLWLAGLISFTGDWVLFTALPIYVYTLTRSPLATSIAFASETLPSILLGSVAGVFVDRWPRKRLMVLSNGLLAITLLPLVLVRTADLVWIVFVVGAVQSTVAQFFRPAESAVLPTLVSEDLLVSANSLSSLNGNVSRLVGPAIGGAIAVATGLTGVTLVDAASFAIAALLVTFLVMPASTPVEPAASEAALRAVWRQWLEGLRLIRGNRALIVLIGLFTITTVGEGVFGTMFVIWVKTELHGTALQFGWFMSAQAVGGVVGGLVIGVVGSRVSPLRLAPPGLLLFALLDIALFSYPVLSQQVWIGLILIALVGIPAAASGSSARTLLQLATPDTHRGRVFGALGTTTALAQLLGLVIAGTLGSILGPITLLNVCQGGAYLLSAAVLFTMVAQLRTIVAGPRESTNSATFAR